MKLLTEATGIAPLSATFSKLHARQEIVDPILIELPPSNMPSTVPRNSIPQDKWGEIVQRNVKGESLRKLAEDFGVSYETIRQIIKNQKIYQ